MDIYNIKRFQHTLLVAIKKHWFGAHIKEISKGENFYFQWRFLNIIFHSFHEVITYHMTEVLENIV